MIGFGNYGMAQTQGAGAGTGTITSLTDIRLVKIDPQAEGFFETVRNSRIQDNNIKLFINALEQVEAAKLEAFYKPIYDPSEGSKQIPVIYEKGKKPAVGYSYNWWLKAASKMPAVEGKTWDIASEYQWYAFLVELINKKVIAGDCIEDALEEVVNDSTNLGHYQNSIRSIKKIDLERTGSRCVCGFYDLANTFKILKCSNKTVGGYWVAGGGCNTDGCKFPLADIDHRTTVDNSYVFGVAMLVLG